MILSPILWNSLERKQQQAILQRPASLQSTTLKEQTQYIIDEVKHKGDAALQEMTLKFDRVQLDTFKVSSTQIDTADQKVNPTEQEAIIFAYKQLHRYHQAQLPSLVPIQTCPGVICERQARAISRVGLYVPGGSAPLVSTVLMLAVPAKIAGCDLRVLVTPPNSKGDVDPRILFAAHLCGITEIYKIGGAQAIAALAYGTLTIPKVDKIFGPGNAWVTQAKLLVAQDPNGAQFDLPAGPSELLIIADEHSNPQFIAADLLSQAEHGPDSQVILITTQLELVEQVQKAINQQLNALPRKSIASQALQQSRFIIVDHLEQAIAISNEYAPEHLILNVAAAETWISKITAAGAVFVGPWSAETCGDYVTGANHVLPTYGYARSVSGLSTVDFMSFINFQTVTQEGLQFIGPAAEILSEMESLLGHKNAISIRLAALLNTHGNTE